MANSLISHSIIAQKRAISKKKQSSSQYTIAAAKHKRQLASLSLTQYIAPSLAIIIRENYLTASYKIPLSDFPS